MLRIPAFPVGEIPSEDFTVTVNNYPIRAYAARVSAVPYNTPWPGHQRPLEQTEQASFLSFETDEPVTVRITANRDFSEVVVRPNAKGILPRVQGRSIELRLRETGAYTVETDGFHRALHIFVNPPLDCGAGQMLYFGPGVHEAGVIRVHSHDRIFIDAGAVVYGCIVAVNADDVQISGYGILDGSREKRTNENSLLPLDYSALLPKEEEAFLAACREQRVLNGNIRLYNCTNVKVRGLVARDAATFSLICANCINVEIDGYKTIGMWRYNSDGIDVFNCNGVVIRNCFLRNFDDCIVIKGIAGWDARSNENISVRDCTVWCDWGRALELGAETNAPEFKNILFENCDLIHGCTVYMDIQHHNYADIHNVQFRNIRCEYNVHQLPEKYQPSDDVPYDEAPVAAKQPVLMGLFVYNMGLFAAKRRYRNGRIHDILFEGIRVFKDEEMSMPESHFAGLDEKHDIRNVRIHNLTVNGEPVKDAQQACLRMHDWVSGVTLT